MMKKYAFGLFTFLSLAPKIGTAITDPVVSGGNYILSNNYKGDDYYFGCGSDNLCSMVRLVGAQGRDAVTLTCIDGSTPYTCTFGYNYNTEVLDARDAMVDGGHSVGAFSNTGKNGQWYLYSWPDGTYNLENALEDETLDIYGGGNDEPFVNTKSAESLSGQHWYFRTAMPQTTITQTQTSTSTVNIKATSTTTVTMTTCLAARSLQARQAALGSAIFSTTTNIVYSTVVTTTTINNGPNIITQTSTINSCPPTKTVVSVTTQPGPTQSQVSISTQGTTATATIQISVSVLTTTQTGTGITTSSGGQATGTGTGGRSGSSAGVRMRPEAMLVGLMGMCVLGVLRVF